MVNAKIHSAAKREACTSTCVARTSKSELASRPMDSTGRMLIAACAPRPRIRRQPTKLMRQKSGSPTIAPAPTLSSMAMLMDLFSLRLGSSASMHRAKGKCPGVHSPCA